MRIERLKREHIGALCEIEKECFGTCAWTAESFESELSSESSVFFTALSEEGMVIGCTAMNNALGQGFISKVMVAPSYRRKGIAGSLLQCLLDYACENDMFELTLEVRESNEAAIALYRRFGFEMLGKRKKFYRDPMEDALIMTRKI